MRAFLSKISQLEAIQEVLFLSNRGELLFVKTRATVAETTRRVLLWNEIIAGLGRPVRAELLFADGRCYLHTTNLGYVIVGMKSQSQLSAIRMACASVEKKLANPSLCRDVLLKMTVHTDPWLIPHYIRALVPFVDDRVCHTLADFVENKIEAPPQLRKALYLALCETLSNGPKAVGIALLQRVLHVAGAQGVAADGEVAAAAQAGLDRFIGQPPPALPENNYANPVMVGSSSVLSESPPEGISWLDERSAAPRVDAPSRQEVSRATVGELMLSITAAAKARQFREAERLREQLIATDPTAIMEIVRAAEIIDDGKRSAISSDHLLVWKELVNELSREEFASLYHVMEQRRYGEGQMVVRQGEFLSTLFFVNNGRVQIFANSQEREVVLSIAGPGQILGADTFFDVSVWTVNVRSQGATVFLLSWDGLQSLKESCPALSAKLTEYCSRFPSPNTLFRRTGRTRRHHERKKTGGRIAMVLLDEDGNETRFTAKGDLLDISRGGMAFALRFSKKKNAMALLGRKLRVTAMSEAQAAANLLPNGRVMAVRCHDFIGSDFSLHIEFDTQLPGSLLQSGVWQKS